MVESRWARGSNQYKKRAKSHTGHGEHPEASPYLLDSTPVKLASAGVSFSSDQIPLDMIKASSTPRAVARFARILPDTVWSDVALEGNTCTLPEVRTLIDGIGVGGKSVSDQRQVENLAQAYKELLGLVETGKFALDAQTSNRINWLLARDEALDAGMFRGQGLASGGGHVRLSDGTTVDGIEPGPDGEVLVSRYAQMLDELDQITEIRLRALAYFAGATKTQFYFDGNKRTARLMAAGYLMSNGFEAVSVHARWRKEFNMTLDELFSTGDATGVMSLLARGATKT